MLEIMLLFMMLNNPFIELPVEEVFIYDIPLSEELQEFTWEQSQKYDLSYELVLAVMKVESDFREDVVSYNNTSVGICQINAHNTADWLAQRVGLKEYNLKNPKHSIKMATWYLKWLSDYWRKQGLSEELIFNATLLSYNRGIQGSINYITEYGYSHKYVEKVYKFKSRLEQQQMQ